MRTILGWWRPGKIRNADINEKSQDPDYGSWLFSILCTFSSVGSRDCEAPPMADEASSSAAAAIRKISSACEEFFDIAKVSLNRALILKVWKARQNWAKYRSTFSSVGSRDCEAPPVADEASRSAAAAIRKISSVSEEFFDIAKVSLIKTLIFESLKGKEKLGTLYLHL